MVGRLVEEQRLGLAVERLRQQHAHFLPALQLAHRASRAARRRYRAPGAAPRRRFPLSSRPLRRRSPRARRGASRLRSIMSALRVEGIALCQCVPEPLVSHDDRVDHAVLVERVVILAQHAELRRTDHRAALRLEVARQQLHERGLAGAVRAGQPVSPPWCKGRRDVLEQDLRTVAHGHTIDSDHENRILWKGFCRTGELLIVAGAAGGGPGRAAAPPTAAVSNTRGSGGCRPGRPAPIRRSCRNTSRRSGPRCGGRPTDRAR